MTKRKTEIKVKVEILLSKPKRSTAEKLTKSEIFLFYYKARI